MMKRKQDGDVLPPYPTAMAAKKERLQLKVSQVRALQTKHGISNLLAPGMEDAPKLANVDVLADIHVEGSKHWDTPLTIESVEDLTTDELMAGVKGLFNPEGK